MIKEVKCNTFKNCEIVVLTEIAQNVELTRKSCTALDDILREPSICERVRF